MPQLATIEVTEVAPTPDDGPSHTVCHCSNDNTAWCGLDVTHEPMLDGPADGDCCPLCGLVSDELADHCPWGCICEECGDE